MSDLRQLLAAATPGPWHRHTYGHSTITQIVRVLGRALRNGEWRSTDATFIHADGDDGEGPSVAFTGNGPKQTNNADLIAYLVNHAQRYADLEDAGRGLIEIYLASPEAAAALAEALHDTVGRNGWLRSTPPDPTAEWLENAVAILAAWRKGLTP